MSKTVLVVDDKEMMRDSVCVTLQRAGFGVATAADGQQALDTIAKRRPDAVVTDLKMPGISGIELLERIKAIDDDLPVVLMTAFGTIETAVTAIKLGAFDYLTKPFEGDELIITVKRAIEHGRLIRENNLLRAAAGLPDSDPAPAGSGPVPRSVRTGLDRLIGSSAPMRTLREQIRAIAGSQGTVLIIGQSGVGKEVVARALHECSPRRAAPFLAVNCAALSESLLESELFGHEKGAFTGADKLRKGRFELADGGTLLLDEVSEVSPQIQAKLLRVLQERAFERVGSSTTIGIDVRVVATSNRDLPAAVAKGEFRQDLFFRLNVLPITVPTLAQRVDDVTELAQHFAAEVCRREGRPIMGLDPDAAELLRAYAWPGNVRELQNICERAVVLSQVMGLVSAADFNAPATISRDLLEPWLNAASAAHARASSQLEAKPNYGTATAIPSATPISQRTLEEIEREAIVQTLQRFNGHRQRTATALGIGVRTLGLKLKKWKELRLVEATL